MSKPREMKVRARFPYLMIGLSLVGGAVMGFYLALGTWGPWKAEAASAEVAAVVPAVPRYCDYSVLRSKGHARVQPIVSVETACTSPRLDAARDSIASNLDRWRSKGYFTAASVYVRNMENNDWTVVNGDEQFTSSGSRRMSLLITYLAEAEKDLGLLDKQLRVIDAGATPCSMKQATEKPVVVGQKYSVRELLRRDIQNEDVAAHATLMAHVNKEELRGTVMTMRGYDGTDPDEPQPITVRRFSTPLKAIFDGGLLSPINSEFALSLLSSNKLRDGLAAGVPGSVDVVERSTELEVDGEHEIHQCGIFYTGGTAYMVTLLARGKDSTGLKALATDLSSLVYGRLRGSQRGV